VTKEADRKTKRNNKTAAGVERDADLMETRDRRLNWEKGFFSTVKSWERAVKRLV